MIAMNDLVFWRNGSGGLKDRQRIIVRQACPFHVDPPPLSKYKLTTPLRTVFAL